MRKPPPAGWEIVESTLEEFEAKMREAETDPHEGKRKTEAVWPIFRASVLNGFKCIYNTLFRFIINVRATFMIFFGKKRKSAVNFTNSALMLNLLTQI